MFIRNFKCVKELDIELAPLTIFVGPNGSGKSSILETLALMSQASSNNVSIRSESAIHGELLNYEKVEDILYRRSNDVELGLGIVVNIQTKKIKKYYEEDLQRTRSLDIPYVNFLQKLNLNKESIEFSYSTSINSDGNTSYSISIDNEELYHVIYGLRVLDGSKFLPDFHISNYYSIFLNGLIRVLREMLAKVYYLSAHRGVIPWRKSPPSGFMWVGREGQYTLEVINELLSPEHKEQFLPYLVLSEKFGIKDLWVGWRSLENGLTSNYIDPYFDIMHKFPSLGYGSKQLLPIIAQLAYSEPESIVMIEEPEISLHPQYQRLLPVLFGLAVKEGKQILVTTHSSYFPLSLDLILEGYKIEAKTIRGPKSYEVKLSQNDIKVYHVNRNNEGDVQVRELKLSEKGLEEAIPSFIEVEREIFERFIKSEEE